MSYPLMASSVPLVSNRNFDEHRWVIQIRRTLEEELEDHTDLPVCIFTVPKILMSSKPEVYSPQKVALGPYHRWNPELYDMEKYKIAAAKTVQKQLPSFKFDNLVDLLIKHEARIRACYHKYLDVSGETLGWMMAVDASFLLEFLHVYAIKEAKILTRISSGMSHLVDGAGRKSGDNEILRDILLLENQVPLFVLKLILELQYQSNELAEEVFYSMVIGLYKEICPLVTENYLPCNQVMECAHLLDIIYHMMVPTSQLPREISQLGQQKEIMEMDAEEESSKQPTYVKQFITELWRILSKLNHGPIRGIKKLLISGPIKLLAKLPWSIITRIPGFAIIKKPLECMFSKENIKSEEGSSSKDENKPPLIEEITIPSVSELSNSGVLFLPTNKDMPMICFDPKTVTLYLPTVSLDVNTEVVLRNLVAYEATSATGPLVIARFTELMNGIIDTEEDARMLCEKGIVLNRLKSNAEVANLWNGMSKSVRLTKVSFLDKVIEDVNKYYSGRWKVKLRNYMKVYVYGSWQFLTLLAAVFFLFLMFLQSFCSVYTCSKFLRDTTSM